ncbi:MAG: T9SS type A sorting domain-containing protein [Bacteroidota bacterium]
MNTKSHEHRRLKNKAVSKKMIALLSLTLTTTAFSQEVSASDSLTTRDELFSCIKVVPNPTSEILFIRNGDEISSYQLYNMSGQKVQESKNNVQVISLIDEEPGFYFLLLEIKGVAKTFRVQKY